MLRRMVALVAVIHTIVFISFASSYVEQLANFIVRFFLDNNSTIGLGTRLSLTMGMPSPAHWGRVGIAQVHIRHCAELHAHMLRAKLHTH